MKSFTPNVKIELDRFDDYWDGIPKLKHATFAFNSGGNVRALSLQSKEADIVYHLPTESLGAIPKDEFQVVSMPSLQADFIIFNLKKSILQDQHVRKALDLLIDRKLMANQLMGEQASPANGPFMDRLHFMRQLQCKSQIQNRQKCC